MLSLLMVAYLLLVVAGSLALLAALGAGLSLFSVRKDPRALFELRLRKRRERREYDRA